MGSDRVTVDLLREWHQATDRVGAALGVVLEQNGLSEAAGGVLWALDPDAPPPTLRDLARMLGCDPSNASLISGKLERQGLLERLPHPTDGRARVLVLTTRGAQLQARLLAGLASTTPLSRLTPTEREQLATLLRKMEP